MTVSLAIQGSHQIVNIPLPKKLAAGLHRTHLHASSRVAIYRVALFPIDYESIALPTELSETDLRAGFEPAQCG